ncbi:MAG: NrfD/PsrC family molybdoenzyme membrane anchor subunit [Dehalococcoidia bacterium]|nr:NrfD/PsrC family molybdoenzyme membrane anchor subunit [Dehalococcoidia bacterium]MDZ4245651.1 NrfD/PsrC family molybdoenzyme membrane anchor subunit [Dehalococcoidia bacterium]
MIDPTFMADFTFQREWVEKKGFLLVLAFFLGGLGGGLYLVSLYLDFYLPGMITGFLIVALGKSSTHLAYLGKPWRFWRGFLKPQNSWISRGLIAITLFVIFAFLQLLPAVAPGLPWNSNNSLITVFVLIGGISLIAYTGFALGVVNAIPIWNTALMPALFIVYSLLGGAGLAAGILAASGGPASLLATTETLLRVLLVTAAILLVFYLWIGYYSTPGGKKSVLELLKGKVAPFFMFGVLLFGIIIPLVTAFYAYFFHVSPVWITTGVACELVGGFFVRYSILKAGIYAPLV